MPAKKIGLEKRPTEWLVTDARREQTRYEGSPWILPKVCSQPEAFAALTSRLVARSRSHKHGRRPTAVLRLTTKEST